MLYEVITIVQDFQQHGLPAVPEDTKQASMSKGDAELINGVFEQMKAIFPAWQRAFPLPKAEAAAKKEWTKALIESGVTTEQQIKFGLQQARAQNLPFFPSPGQFISWCKPTPEMFGLPSVEMALMDVARHRSTVITSYSIHYTKLYERMWHRWLPLLFPPPMAGRYDQRSV